MDQDVNVPAGAIYGPKAMLINGMAGSGGDAMPWYFRKMKVGPLIGTRTWGGLVAAMAGPRLMDGGFYTAPDAAVYGLEGQWEVENAGVPPDIEVELDPAAWRSGRDTQLERAVEVLLGELKNTERKVPVRPAYPTYERCCGLNGGNTPNQDVPTGSAGVPPALRSEDAGETPALPAGGRGQAQNRLVGAGRAGCNPLRFV